MTDSPRRVFSADITPPGPGWISIEATEGTQMIGSSSGHPMDATEPGTVSITVQDPETGITAKIQLDFEFAAFTRRTLEAAVHAADTRDHSKDRPLQKWSDKPNAQETA